MKIVFQCVIVRVVGGVKEREKNIYVQHQVFLQSASRIFVHIPNFLKAKSLVKKTVHCLKHQ